MPQPPAIRVAARADLDALTQLIEQTPPEELVDFEHADRVDLDAFDRSMADAGAPVTRLVAVAAQQLLGAAQYFRVPWTSRAGHYWATVRIAPAQRLGRVGSALLDHVIAAVGAEGGRSLALELRAPQAELLAAAERAQFREVFRSIEYHCAPQSVDLHPFRAAPERATAAGVQIMTLPELQRRDPDWLEKLHRLYLTLSRDVPIPERAVITPAGLAEFVGSLPDSLPQACYIAIAADTSYVGVSFMHQVPGQPILLQKLTGVLAEYRGHGIALALKVATVAFAQQHGYEKIITWIETNNAPMISLATRLGFVQQPGGIVVVERDLAARNE
jgi:mycothiol synthase